MKKNDINGQLFFRGQGVDYWEIRPSIFRENMLSVEHSLMSEPLRQVPEEFKTLGGSFEVMEKYQHYGMCTRLLDVTTNPLVALYFACEHHAEEEYRDPETKEIERRSPQGRVYFKEEGMPLIYNALPVKVISKLASYDLSNNITLMETIQNLYEDGIISSEQTKRWSNEKGILEFINLCQSVCTVLPIMNNDRLIRQSGAFLLPGKFIITERGSKIQDAIITKAECNLREEFEKTFFYINDENKEAIREELEHCNISEANLFPELEYQLRYIRRHNESQRRAVAYFEKFQKIVQVRNDSYQEDVPYNRELVKEIIATKELGDSIIEEIAEIFEQNQTIDWVRRDSVLSKIKIQICKKLIDNHYNKQEADKLASDIVENVVKKYTKR